MRILMTMIKKGKLTAGKANAIIEGKKSNLKGEPAPLNRHKLPLTDNSGQVFPSRRGGDAAEADMLLSDM